MLELTEVEQVEYDGLYKALVAQGGPTVGKLKAAGHKDPEGVARLVELGWVNPEADAVVVDSEEVLVEVETKITSNLIVEEKRTNGRLDVPEEETELDKANKEAEEAQKIAEEAIKEAEEKAAVAESKKPAPCFRCNGDGTWHSLKTGYRAKTSTEPLHDASRVCPECK